jgi:GalNAc-alpha-(1->4)-GalNAc-alpha-(1->3)-diNAcBac-PP-undecaprenol alpha-1,4-N-acetyl-D-galactosaminyltransferase
MKNQKSKRIVFLIGSMGRGGAERVISILANHYSGKGWKVDIILLLNNRCEYELNKNVSIIPICNQTKTRLRQLPNWISSIRKYVKENKPDRIVSFIARINIITIISCIGLKQSITVSERNDPTKDGRGILVKIGTNLLYPFSNKVVFQTKWAQSCFSNRVQRKSVVISNPVHVLFEEKEKKCKKIVSVGRLIEQKNHSLLINAFKIVHNLYPEYKLYIYGEGRLRDSIERQIDELELTNFVFLPGNVSEVHKRISDAEMFVLSSDYEGLSNALLEAMMMGLPIISTNCAGANEIISNNQNGLLVELGDCNQLAQAMIQLINDKKVAKILGEKGKKAVEYMKTENIITNWEQTIES